MDHRIAALGVAVLLTATACGGGDGQQNDDDPRPSSSRTTQQGTTPVPGADGKVAAVDGSTAQVQSRENGQVAVTWTSSTTFTREVRADLSDLKAGDCVMVVPETDEESSTDDSTVRADSVRITTGSSGSCTPPGGPGGGGGPVTQGSPPSGAPGGAPDGAPDGAPRLRGSFGAFGKVTAVSASGFTVSSVRPEAPGSATGTPTEVRVTTGSSTTYTTTAKATASDVKVGSCLNARGRTDSTGAVTATAIALSAAVDGECGAVFRLRQGGPGGPGGPAGPGGTGSSTQES